MIQYMENASYDWSVDSIRIINTPSASAKMTFFYVQEMGYFKTVPPYFTERAGLTSYLILYTLTIKLIFILILYFHQYFFELICQYPHYPCKQKA